MEIDFAIKVKTIVKKNFNESIEIYSNFERKYNFFYNLALELGNFIQIKKDSVVLDAGCGCGFSMKAIYDNFTKNVYGVDISENMIEFGKNIYPDLNFYVGDVGLLDKYFNEKFFDFILFNLVVFILPDVEDVFTKCNKLLKNGGKIGFSYYPEILDEKGKDLLKLAFERSGLEFPRKNVISSYFDCLNALERANFKNITEGFFEMPISIEFLNDFFSIPAQSASLFPKLNYPLRKENVKRIFDALKDFENQGKVIWRFVRGEK